MVKSCDSAWPRPRHAGKLATSACSDALSWIDREYEVQSSRSGKALGIGELFASACSASAPLDRS